MQKIFFIVLLIISQKGFSSDFFYSLAKPDFDRSLPVELKEISGLTDVNDSQFACVQDEHGILYLYNMPSSSISKRINFGPPGDYEGLTRVGNDYYVLHSNGDLIELIDPFSEGKFSSKTYNLKLQSPNNEGLCYDPITNSLLIAAKSKGIEKNERLIYSFDLKKKICSEIPWMTLHLDKLKSDVGKFGIKPIQKVNKNGKVVELFNFRPASLAIHPKSGEIYIISAADFLLIVLDRNSKVKHALELNESLFEKAEGITFLPDHSMIITSEGVDFQPKIFKFDSKDR
ncbi:MAG: SdiA-regulated domain-containing protein [Bacteroidetes bacterium]|nr:SdiA-regulated domain-containing protein [Bacteroidota bacterium]